MIHIKLFFSPSEEDDHYDIIKELTSLAARWKDIGIALRLKNGQLNEIESKNPGKPQRCLSDVIENWLKRNYNVKKFGPPTWRWLVEIVAHQAGGNDKDLADKIARQYPAKSNNSKSCFCKHIIW